MANQSARPPFFVFADIDGTLLQNGYIYLGVPNKNPETDPVAVYWDVTLTQAAPQPLRTLNGLIIRSGTPANAYTLDDFSMTVKNKQMQIVYSIASYAAQGAIFGFAASGANNDITSLLGLTTPLSPAQGGTQMFSCGVATGAPNALIFSLVTPSTGFVLQAGVRVTGIVATDNTGPTTINVASTGDVAVKVNSLPGEVPLVGGELQAGMIADFEYDGAIWQLLNPFSSIHSDVQTFNNTVNLNSVVAYKEQTLIVTTGNAAWDMSQAPNALVNLNIANTTLLNPTGQIVGASGVIKFLVDATGNRLLTFGASYNMVSDAFWAGANRETEYFYKVVAASGANSIELRAKTPRFILYPAQATTAGTSIDFLNIPTWARKITVLLNGVSTNGSSLVIIQIGNGSPEITGYGGAISWMSGFTAQSPANGFAVSIGAAAAEARSGHFLLMTIGGNAWAVSHSTFTPSGGFISYGSGIKSTSAAPTILRLTTVNGVDTFDLGSATILVEG